MLRMNFTMKIFLHLIALVSFDLICLIQSTPTIVPFPEFDARKDAETLHNALEKYGGADRTVMGDILSNRSCGQRMEISKSYVDLYKKYIVESIASETESTYEQLCKDSFVCGDIFMAVHLRRAFRNERERSATEILVAYSVSAEKHTLLTELYKKIFDRPYEEDIKTYFKDDFENVLLEMSARKRQPDCPVDEAKCQEIAEKLKEGIGDWGDNRQFLDATLFETPLELLKCVINKFKDINGGKDLSHVFKDEFRGAKEDVYRSIIFFYMDPIAYYAQRLWQSVHGHGTDEQTLIRIVVGRSENDLKEIQDQFQKAYNRELGAKIGTDVSGPFEGLLRKFITGNVQTNQPQ